MKIKDIVQTVIFLCFLIMVPIFGLAYSLYSQTALKDYEILDKSFGIMIGVFSGAATLAAAYIASLLFNDWREQHNKQVDSDFIMKLYDNLFEMRYLSLNVTGFMRDYLTNKSKQDHNHELIENNKTLCYLTDYSALKLSDIAYVITEDEYIKKFEPQIKTIILELHLLNDLYKSFIESQDLNKITIEYKNMQDLKSIDEELQKTLLDLNDRYKSFMIELKKYYKA